VSGFSIASAACAASTGFWVLVAARVVQGFFGGFLIPLVFSTVFLVFEDGVLRVRATMLAGLLAMLAPTLGPSAGGFITDQFSWHWLFLINVPPGILAALVVAGTIAIDRADWRHFRTADLASMPLLIGSLATLQLIMREAPGRGWFDATVLLLLAASAGCAALLWRRCRRHVTPLIDLQPFQDRNFVVGCFLSCVLGFAVYGATYLLPVFLGIVRQHDATEIGVIMLVTGMAQLVMAPVATLLTHRFDQRLVTAGGYLLLAIGFLSNGAMTIATDATGLFWQQLARGAAMMVCLLPTTALSLNTLPTDEVPNASGLFNLMRNLGGAIALATIDTILAERAPVHARALAARLMAGDRSAAIIVGLPLDRFNGHPLTNVDQATRDIVTPLVERAGLVQAFNEAWIVLGVVVLVSVLAVPLLRCPKQRTYDEPRIATEPYRT
jgi:DHA2 family multidrug resistance protein